MRLNLKHMVRHHVPHSLQHQSPTGQSTNCQLTNYLRQDYKMQTIKRAKGVTILFQEADGA